MNEARWTPEEFARLIALPDTHPERAAAERSPQFAAMRAMLADFERAPQADPDVDSARAELARRLGKGSARDAAAAPAAPAPARPAARSWLDPLRDAFAPPAARWGLAFAAIAAVATVGWWSMLPRPNVDAIRGERPVGAFELHAAPVEGGLQLDWPAVPAADGYAIVFLGDDLAEVARIDAGPATRWVLSKDALPPPLVSGTEVSVEVEARKSGVKITSTPARTIPLP